MANRFKKSIENIDEKNETIVYTEKINEQPEVQSNILSNITSNILEDILDKKNKGKSVALYLSSDVDKIITNLAKQKCVSKSKVVDSILRQVFFNS